MDMNEKWYKDWCGFGNRIRNTREKMGISREALAERIETSDKNLGRIEAGVQATTIETLYRISTVLNVSCDYLLLNQEEQGNSNEQICTNEQISAIVKLLENYSNKELSYIFKLIRDVLLLHNLIQAKNKI